MTESFSSLFAYLVSNPDRTAGEAFIHAKNRRPDEFSRRLTFLGDPAIRIKRPAAIAGASQPITLPAGFVLYQNFPNSFNPSTTMRYALPKASTVSLAIFNALGQQVAILLNGEADAGYHELRYDGSHLASGVYFCRMLTGSFVGIQKLVLAK